MKFKPLRDKILIKRLEAQAKSAGGIIIPDTAQERQCWATVVAVGSGKLLENGTLVPHDCVPGDRVMIGRWGGTEIEIDGVAHLVIGSDEVLGVEEPPPKRTGKRLNLL